MDPIRALLRRSRPDKLGLLEVVTMGVGGMVSGGIYAVLGVAMRQAGNAVPVSYLIAGCITVLTLISQAHPPLRRTRWGLLVRRTRYR